MRRPEDWAQARLHREVHAMLDRVRQDIILRRERGDRSLPPYLCYGAISLSDVIRWLIFRYDSERSRQRSYAQRKKSPLLHLYRDGE